MTKISKQAPALPIAQSGLTAQQNGPSISTQQAENVGASQLQQQSNSFEAGQSLPGGAQQMPQFDVPGQSGVSVIQTLLGGGAVGMESVWTPEAIEGLENRLGEIDNLLQSARLSQDLYLELNAEKDKITEFLGAHAFPTSAEDIEDALEGIAHTKEVARLTPEGLAKLEGHEDALEFLLPLTQGGGDVRAAVEERLADIEKTKMVAFFSPEGLARINSEQESLQSFLAADALPQTKADVEERIGEIDNLLQTARMSQEMYLELNAEKKVLSSLIDG